MDQYDRQRRIFNTLAILVLGSVFSLIAVIPVLIEETNASYLPIKAPIEVSIGAGIHLLLFIGFLIGSRLARLKGRVNREINLVSAIVLLVLGIIVMDRAFAYLGSLTFASIGMFLGVSCNLAAAIVAVAAYFKLKPKKEKPAS